MSVPKQENTSDPIPDIEATYNGSSVVLYNYDELQDVELAGPKKAVLLRESNFADDSPIERLTVSSVHHKTLNDYGTVFRAEIDIRDMDEMDWDKFLWNIQDANSEFTQISDGVELEEDTKRRGLYKLIVLGNPILTVEINPNIPHVTIHTAPDGDVELPENGTEAADDTARFFMSSVVRTLDVIGGALLEEPMEFRHNRSYMLTYDGSGEPVPEMPVTKPEAPKAIEAGVGKVALKVTTETEIAEGLKEHIISFDDIAGYNDLKKHLERLAFVSSRPDILEKWGANRPGGVMLHGPAGTGKTTLLHAIATAAGATEIEIHGNEVYTKWVGSSDKKFNALLDQAEAQANSSQRVFVLFDELDTLISSSLTTSDERTAVRGSFKRRIPKLAANPNIILGATTNNYDSIDSTLLRSGRFDIKIKVPLPELDDRIQILLPKINSPELDFELLSIISEDPKGPMKSVELSDTVFFAFSDGVDLEEIAKETRNFSGADIANLINRIRFEKAASEIMGENPSPITQQDVLREIAKMRSEHVGEIDLADEAKT